MKRWYSEMFYFVENYMNLVKIKYFHIIPVRDRRIRVQPSTEETVPGAYAMRWSESSLAQVVRSCKEDGLKQDCKKVTTDIWEQGQEKDPGSDGRMMCKILWDELSDPLEGRQQSLEAASEAGEAAEEERDLIKINS